MNPGGQQDGEHEEDPFEDLVLDEDFVRGATHKEASARARMLSAKWRDNPPEDPGSRDGADGRGGAPGQGRAGRARGLRRLRPRRPGRLGRPGKPGRSARPGPPPGYGDGKDRTNLKIAVVFVLSALLLLGISQRDRISGWFGSSGSSTTPRPTAPPSAGTGSSGTGSTAPAAPGPSQAPSQGSSAGSGTSAPSSPAFVVPPSGGSADQGTATL